MQNKNLTPALSMKKEKKWSIIDFNIE